jgi:ZIP family zinc transporter
LVAVITARAESFSYRIVLGQLPGADIAVLVFGAAAPLGLDTEELLTEAHAVPETRITGVLFVAGFLTLRAIELLTVAIDIDVRRSRH